MRRVEEFTSATRWRLWAASSCLIVTAAVLGPPNALAASTETAAPVVGALSPTAPNPHPPLGARAPDGSVPGGTRLAGRGLILPAGARRLPPNLTARSWVLSDLDTGQVLAARDPHGRYQPASILKILTTVTILPHLPGRRVVTVSTLAAGAEGSAVGLLAGAKYTVDELFRALLLVSANDAATALAEANGGVSRTVAQMNAEAGALGGYDTLVQTPSGLDGWQQLTSAYDMSLFLRAALQQPRFAAYDRTASGTFPPKKSRYGSVGGYQFDNQSSDFFQTVPGALVAKTGFTDAAQHTYLAAAERHGRRLGIVFLRNRRAPLDQYQQAAALFDWGFALPSTTPAVGVLAGPISAAGRSSVAPPPSAARSDDTAAPGTAARLSAASPGLDRGRIAVTAGGAGLLAVAGVATLRRRRRRSRRQY